MTAASDQWADALRAHEEALFAAREAEAAAFAAYLRASDDLARVVDSLTAQDYGRSTA